jgi:hypothetical protein
MPSISMFLENATRVAASESQMMPRPSSRAFSTLLNSTRAFSTAPPARYTVFPLGTITTLFGTVWMPGPK